MNPVDPREGSTPESRFMKIRPNRKTRPGTQKIMVWNQNQTLKKRATNLKPYNVAGIYIYIYITFITNK